MRSAAPKHCVRGGNPLETPHCAARKPRFAAVRNSEMHAERPGAAKMLRFALAASLVALLALVAAPDDARAAPAGAEKFARTLSPVERKVFEDYLSAKDTHDFKSDAYWREVSDMKAL